MNLENQVVSLQLAQQLKELNCKQESLFYWYTTTQIWTKQQIEEYGASGPLCSAFTVAELGELLPFSVMIRGRVTGWDCYKREDGQGWEIWLQENTRLVGNKIEATTEADARALLLIHLIKNDLWKHPLNIS